MGFSYKTQHRIDKIFTFGIVGFGVLLVGSLFKKCSIKNGYFIPEEQKNHLKGGAAYVKKQFDEADITPPDVETARQVSGLQRENTVAVAPQVESKQWFPNLDTMTGGTTYRSPLGSTLTEGFSGNDSHTALIPTINEKESSSPKSNDVAVTESDKKGFSLALSTVKGAKRHFDFSVNSVSSSGLLNMDITERSIKNNDSGTTAQLNFVYFNPKRQSELGRAFSVVFCQKVGCYTAAYNPALGHMIFVANGDNITVSYNGRVQVYKGKTSIPSAAQIVYHGKKFVETRGYKVSPTTIRQHQKNTPVLYMQNERGR